VARLAEDWQAGRVPVAERSARWKLETWRWIARLSEYQLRGVDDARFLLPRSCAAAAPLLAEALHDENVYVRVHAAQCLERMGPRGASAGPELLAALADPTLAPNAAAALGGVRYGPALPVLLGLCARGGEPELRLSAVRAIGAYGPETGEKTAAALLPLCAPEEALEVRQAAAESLARIGSPQAPLALLAGFLTDERLAYETSERALREWLAREAASRPAAAQALERWDALAPATDRAVPADERARLRSERRAVVEQLLAGP
jgi:HEAT repeat protein